VPTFKPIICQKSRAIAEKFKDETMEVKLERWEAAHKKSLEVAIKIKDKDATEWEREVLLLLLLLLLMIYSFVRCGRSACWISRAPSSSCKCAPAPSLHPCPSCGVFL
jgi:hypothetical protein